MTQLRRTILILLLVSFPLLIILTSIRLALTPLYVEVEYRLPGFPADTYGFSLMDRLYWSKYSVHYLLGRISHLELSAQTLLDGSSLFNPRELSHMLDVRNLTAVAMQFWYGLLILLVLASLLSIYLGKSQDLFLTFRKGAWWTIGLIILVLIFVGINFDMLFTNFHQLFFEEDSWLFLHSDNLIRLFPVRFWRDIFIFIGGTSVMICGFVLLFIHPKSTK